MRCRKVVGGEKCCAIPPRRVSAAVKEGVRKVVAVGGCARR